MVTRFRYTDRRGDELELRDIGALHEHVASGRITEETLLHDAVTGLFAPAREHEAYRFVVEELDRSVPGGGEAEPPDEEGWPMADLEVTLADPQEPESSAEFVERLRREREQEGSIPGLSGFRTGRRDDLLLGRMDDEQVAPREPRKRSAGEAARELVSWSEPPPERTVEPERGAPVGSPPAPPRRPAPSPIPRPAPSGVPRSAPPPRWRRAVPHPVRTAGLVVILLGEAYLALDAQPDVMSAEAPAPAAVAASEVLPTLEPADAASRLAMSEGIAFHHMVDGMDSLARAHRVYHVPAVWLEGEYMAGASGHPEVEDYWGRYLDFVTALRREDAALFRRSFVARLQDLDVSPSVVSLRLAQAKVGFERSQAARDAMYRSMEDLARTGLELHRLLVAREADIELVPLDVAYAARDPFLRIDTRDDALQAQVYGLLDRVLEDLEALHGETRWTRSAMNDGVLRSIRATHVPAAEGTAADGTTSGGR